MYLSQIPVREGGVIIQSIIRLVVGKLLSSAAAVLHGLVADGVAGLVESRFDVLAAVWHTLVLLHVTLDLTNVILLFLYSYSFFYITDNSKCLT